MLVERNDKCPCESGQKFKKCCYDSTLSDETQKWFVDLQRLTRNSNLFDNLKVLEKLGVESIYEAIKFEGLILGSWHIAFLAIQLIRNHDPNISKALSRKDFAKSIALALEIPYQDGEKEFELEDYRYFIKLFYSQNSNNQIVARLWGRGLIFYKYFEDYSKTAEISISDLFEELYGLDNNTFFFVGLAFHASIMQNNGFNIQNILNTKEKTLQKYITKESVDKFIKALSNDPDELRKQYINNFDVKSIEFKLNPLVKYPIVDVDGNLAIPVPRLILEKIFSGIFYDFSDHYMRTSGNHFRKYFGELFENYTRDLILEHLDSKYNIESPIEINGLEIDHLITENSGKIFLIETTLGSTTIKLRENAEPEEIISYCERILAEELRKIKNKMDAVREKRDGEIVPIVVLYEQVPFVNSIFREQIDKILKEKHGIEKFDYHILLIDDFENLCDLVARKDLTLSEIFKEKNKNESFNLAKYILSKLAVSVGPGLSLEERNKIKRKYAKNIQSDWSDYLYFHIADEKAMESNYLKEIVDKFWVEMGMKPLHDS